MYNSKVDQSLIFLDFLIKNTKNALTIFYSGRCDNSKGIEFIDTTISKSLIKSLINEVLCKNSCYKPRITIINDSINGGSAFDIKGCPNTISFSVHKKDNYETTKSKLSHGIFTYYFCKIINESPSISANRLVERINTSLKRFDEKLTCDKTNEELGGCSIFF